MAGEDWVECSVDDIKAPVPNALATGPFGSAISSQYFVNHGVPVIRGGNLSQDIGVRLTDDGLVFLSDERARQFSRSVARRGDLVFTCWGTIDQVGLIDNRSRYSEYVVSNKQMKLTPDPRKVNSLFLYYVFSSPLMRERILNQGIGSSVPGFNLGQLRSIRINLPPLPVQRAIAHILGTLDDKIELNRRMNETLEAMARALFKSWFVDFDPVRAKAEGREPSLPKQIADLFPDSFEDSKLGEIPRGWKVLPLYETARFINGAAFKSEDFCAPGDGLPVVKIAELKDGVSEQTKFSQRTADADHLIDTGDLLYSWSGSPDTSLDAFVWTKGPALLNQHIFKVVASSTAQKRFVYYLLKFLRPQLVEIARNKQTTGLGHVTVADMKRLYLCWPSKPVLAAYDRHASPNFNRAFNNTLETQNLAGLRDTLLPKLISGALRVRSGCDL